MLTWPGLCASLCSLVEFLRVTPQARINALTPAAGCYTLVRRCYMWELWKMTLCELSVEVRCPVNVLDLWIWSTAANHTWRFELPLNAFTIWYKKENSQGAQLVFSLCVYTSNLHRTKIAVIMWYFLFHCILPSQYVTYERDVHVVLVCWLSTAQLTSKNVAEVAIK